MSLDFTGGKSYRVMLAGNPNVGKSTVFNALTGMHQHTGNWSGKTVDTARGTFRFDGVGYELFDLPGCYSLYGGSGEERVARDALSGEAVDAVITVCDATCLERTLILALQVAELHPRTVICVNLMDEAARKGIAVDIKKLSELTGVPCVGVAARSKKGLDGLKDTLRSVCDSEAGAGSRKPPLHSERHQGKLIIRASEIAESCTSVTDRNKAEKKGRRMDRALMGAFPGIPIMLLLLAFILWITVRGANYPSELLRSGLFGLEEIMYSAAIRIGMPPWLRDPLILGIYRILAWVVSVMLPPMAIFFPLFTLLEDFGYLPRAAFNLDPCLRKCGSCGKQALTMCMGLGCNAVGVSGCRIIDSPRERRIAILTNCLMPCNGRFPTVIILMTLFCAPLGLPSGFLSAAGLTLLLAFCVLLTFAASKLLSVTLLKGMPSAFTLELPPYRAPQVGKVIVRSLLDRTVFVLGRAVMVAAPAGLVIWLCSNLTLGDVTLLKAISGWLEPVARPLGMDGVILLAFILGFPANEIVLPIAIMAYSGASTVSDLSNAALLDLLTANGWTTETAVCTVLFCICHFPCSTTLLTVRKETGSWKYTLAAALLPTAMGIVLCLAAHGLFSAFYG
ncbi:MAG: ferrous iron transporter B [Clostridia bacterium]|nr:ferrous iron transporter B [Clostridia bacterium]